MPHTINMQKSINIGRADDNNIVVKHEKVGRKHCCIKQLSENEFVVEDLGSSNGTFVNNRQVKQAQIKIGDMLKLADFEVDVQIVLNLFSDTTLPKAMLYENINKLETKRLEQEKLYADFQKLKTVYEQYLNDKKKLLQGSTLKNTGLRAGLALIPFVGNALGILSSNVTGNVQIKMMERTEQFKMEYLCPSCSHFLGDNPFEILVKRKTCDFCKCKWVKD